MSREVDFLKKVPLFTDLTKEDLKLIDALITDKNYRKGEIIFMEEEPGEALFVIRSGRVKISKTSPDGREQILHILRGGSVFAEVVLFDGGNYPASAETLEDSLIGMLRNKDMENMLKEHSSIAIKMLRLMSIRLRRAQNLIKDLALQDSYGRLAGLLLRFARRQGIKTEKGIVIELTVTRQDLASMVGTTRETVARILSRFKKEGALELSKNQIIIISEEKLKDWM